MAAKYILVEVTKSQLIELRVVNEEELEAVNKGKKPNQYIYKAGSYKSGKAKLAAHNETVSDGVKQISTEAKKPAPPQPANTRILLWDWSKISPGIKADIIGNYNAGNWGQLFKIHNKHKLSKVNYCCDGYKAWVIYNINKGIENGFIQLGEITK